jgi:hypothetical protein
MNATTKAAQAVEMVAAEKSRGLTTNVRGNMIAVQLVRDSMDRAAFASYNETCHRFADALKALKATYKIHNAGGVEIRGGSRELYMTTFEVA